MHEIVLRLEGGGRGVVIVCGSCVLCQSAASYNSFHGIRAVEEKSVMITF